MLPNSFVSKVGSDILPKLVIWTNLVWIHHPLTGLLFGIMFTMLYFPVFSFKLRCTPLSSQKFLIFYSPFTLLPVYLFYKNSIDILSKLTSYFKQLHSFVKSKIFYTYLKNCLLLSTRYHTCT